MDTDQVLKIRSYFPEAERKFIGTRIYSGSVDGWEVAKFKERVFNKGPTLIICKVTNGRICGGYTSKNWDGSNKFVNDSEAFVFSLHTNTKYTPTNNDKAIYTYSNGFCFGNTILRVASGGKLNDSNAGY